MPYSELDYAADGWVEDKRTFQFINMAAPANPCAQTLDLLHELWAERGYGNAFVGYEGNFELVAGNNVPAEARVITPALVEGPKAAPLHDLGTRPCSRWQGGRSEPSPRDTIARYSLAAPPASGSSLKDAAMPMDYRFLLALKYCMQCNT